MRFCWRELSLTQTVLTVQNTAFNSALKQSTAIRRDLSTLSSSQLAANGPDGAGPAAITPASLGALSASLTSFGRTLDEYNALAKQELNPAKQEKAFERVKNFRAELTEYRSHFDNLKTAREDAVHTQNRGELLGRRPYAANTPENPYSNSTATASGQTSEGHGGGGGGGYGMMGSGDVTREQHALREQNFFASTNSALDEYIARGQAVLGDLGAQRDMLKNTQRRLYSVGNTLGISGDTIRMVERRAREDKWIFGAGVVVFFGFCWLCLHFLR